MTQRGVVTCSIFDSATIQHQGTGPDADAIGIGLARRDGVTEAQCRGARTTYISGIDQHAPNVQGELRRACHVDEFAETDCGGDGITRVQVIVLYTRSAGNGNAVDHWRESKQKRITDAGRTIAGSDFDVEVNCGGRCSAKSACGRVECQPGRQRCTVTACSGIG